MRRRSYIHETCAILMDIIIIINFIIIIILIIIIIILIIIFIVIVIVIISIHEHLEFWVFSSAIWGQNTDRRVVILSYKQWYKT